MKKGKNWLYDILLGICILTFLGSGGTLAYKIMVQKRNDTRLEELAHLAEEQADTENETAGTGQHSFTDSPAGEPGNLPPSPEEIRAARKARVQAYGKIKEQNSDMVGWVRIEGTKIDYPVLQTPDRPNFYLDHNFDRKSSIYGAPYMAEECDLSKDCRNFLIYGHHMKNGSMFAALDEYLDQEFLKEHPVIQFDTLEEYGDYQVMAVFSINAADPENPLYDWISCGNQEAFDSYVKLIKRLSVYDTGVEAQWGDHLISLITCEYTHKDGRLIVVGKRIVPE